MEEIRDEDVIRGGAALSREIALDAAGNAPGRIMLYPAGVHGISAFRADGVWSGHVRVDKSTADSLNAVLASHRSGGRKPFLDFDHEGKAASFWLDRFDFVHEGVYASGEYSKAGREAITGKTHRYTSPEFLLDKYDGATAANPARVKGAPICMGSFVNDPAFRAMAPLWARNAAGHATTMENATLTGAAATATATPPTQTAAAAAPGTGGAAPAAALSQASPAAQAAAAPVQASDARETEIAELRRQLQQDREVRADEVIRAAQANGILPASPAANSREAAVQARWRQIIAADPQCAELLLSAPAPIRAGFLTSGTQRGNAGAVSGIAITQEDQNGVLKAMHAERDHAMRGLVYRKEIAPRIPIKKKNYEAAMGIIKAANALGTLTGILVVQRCLELLKFEFPMLSRVTTDFSAEPAKFNQPITTRTRAVVTAGNYDPVAGYVSQFATDTDVDLNINEHIFTQITYTANDLASTARLLFPEQEEGMHFGIGLNMINSLTALMLPANFPGSPAGYLGGPASLGKTTYALDQMQRSALIDMKTALHTRGVVGGTRTAWLSSLYHGALEQDTTIVGNLINPAADDSIRDGTLPPTAGFQPLEAPYFPTNGVNLQGFAHRADALVLAARLPNDYSKIFPGVTGGGVVETVTNPDTSLSVMLVMFLDHLLGHTSMRLAVMYGTAVGNGQCGQLLTSQ